MESTQDHTLVDIYTPVHAGEALHQFFTASPERFGTKADDLLMNQLPMVQQRYLLRNSSMLLLYTYSYNNSLHDCTDRRFIYPDEIIMTAFGGNIPAAAYMYKDEQGKSHKVHMDSAVSQGLIPKPMNTFEVIKTMYPEFDPKRFRTLFFLTMAMLNYHTAKSLQLDENLLPVLEVMQQENVKEAMRGEYEILKTISRSRF